MSEVTVVTDSVACLPAELTAKYQIEIVPLTLLYNGKIIKDGVDITPSQAYQIFQKEPDVFRTAPFSTEDCMTVFRKVALKSKYLLFITLSVKISTAYNVACLAQERARAELPDLRIELLDSETATAAQGFVALGAARTALEGGSLEDCIDAARLIKEKVHAVVLLDTVKYVYRSGRVPKIAAQAASVLNIHPIFNLYGAVNFEAASRTRKSGIERVLAIMREKVGNHSIHCAVMHAYDPEEAERLKTRVNSEFICKELWISEFSPMMGYATGTGTIGLAFYKE